LPFNKTARLRIASDANDPSLAFEEMSSIPPLDIIIDNIDKVNKFQYMGKYS